MFYKNVLQATFIYKNFYLKNCNKVAKCIFICFIFAFQLNELYLGAGSPSASHSIKNGLSFSLIFAWATWNNCSSVGGCLDIRGGDWTNGRYKWQMCITVTHYETICRSGVWRNVHYAAVTKSNIVI